MMHDFSKLLLMLFDLFYVVDLHNQGLGLVLYIIFSKIFILIITITLSTIRDIKALISSPINKKENTKKNK